jgi:hypothetical protein
MGIGRIRGLGNERGKFVNLYKEIEINRVQLERGVIFPVNIKILIG